MTLCFFHRNSKFFNPGYISFEFETLFADVSLKKNTFTFHTIFYLFQTCKRKWLEIFLKALSLDFAILNLNRSLLSFIPFFSFENVNFNLTSLNSSWKNFSVELFTYCLLSSVAPVTVNIKRLSYLSVSPSSGISIVWRADSWCRRQATPQLFGLQTIEMLLDGANTTDS